MLQISENIFPIGKSRRTINYVLDPMLRVCGKRRLEFSCKYAMKYFGIANPYFIRDRMVNDISYYTRQREF